MELKWLEDFLVLCSTKNFRVAAKQRCVSQPAFSRRIQALEAWVDVALFDRSRQPCQLTEAGELFKPKALELVSLTYMVRDDVRRKSDELAEKICFATLGALAQGFIPGWLKKLQPFILADQFSVRTEYRTIEEYFSALNDNSVDFFVCYEDRDIGLSNDKAAFVSMKLGEETLVPVASPDDKGEPSIWLPGKNAEPVACLHCLPPSSPWPIRNHMEKSYSHFEFKTVYSSSLGPTLRAMAIEGFGLAWIPYSIIREDLSSGRLVRAGGPGDDIHVDIMIYRCANTQEPRVENFWQTLRSRGNPANY